MIQLETRGPQALGPYNISSNIFPLAINLALNSINSYSTQNFSTVSKEKCGIIKIHILFPSIIWIQAVY